MQKKAIGLERIYNAVHYRVKKYYYKLIEFKFETYNRYKKSYGLNQEPRDKHIVISLTSYHKRFDVLHLTLESLLNQSYKPDKIILWLSQEDINKKPLSGKLERLKDRGLDIKVVDENIRSYKKLIYTLREYPESHIVTCDDDILYAPSFLEGLIATNAKYPQCVAAYTCRLMKLSNDNEFEPYRNWSYVSYDGPSFNLLPIGASGIMYPPHSLHAEVQNKEIFLKLAPLADDLWFKAMALLNDTKTVLVNNESKTFFQSSGSQDEALNYINVAENKNDEQLKNLFDYYSLYQKLEPSS